MEMKFSEPKSVRLTSKDRNAIVMEFDRVAREKAEIDYEAKTDDLGYRIWLEVYDEEQREAINLLRASKMFLGRGQDNLHLTCKDNKFRNETFVFKGSDKKYFFILSGRGFFSYDSYYQVEAPIFVSTALMDELHDLNSDKKFDDKAQRVANTQLKAVLDLCNTRKEIEALWAPIRDLMGDEWIDEVITKKPAITANLPALKVDALNAAYDKIKPITQVAA